MNFLYGLLIYVVIINLYPSEKGYSLICKLVNVPWWFKNDHDPVDGHPRYLPGKPLWYRRLRWRIRNPLPNFDRYVIGFVDKQEILVDPERPMWPAENRRFRVYSPKIKKVDGKWKISLPWVAYRGKYIEWYFGYKPKGEFGFALRKSHSKAY